MYNSNSLNKELGSAKTYEHTLLDEKSVIDRHRCHKAANVGVFTGLSILLTYFLTASKNHVIKYCKNVYERNGKINLGLLKFR